jgi:metal-responsive CopG/Arc/MetJ family transcriptional regulator
MAISTTTVTIPKTLGEQLNKMAKEEDKPKSRVVTRLLRKGLEAEGIEVEEVPHADAAP